MPTASATATLADLAVLLPAASRVFHRHRLDFCCHGTRPLAEACAGLRSVPRELVDVAATFFG